MPRMTPQEEDLRIRLLNTLFTTPHRKLQEIHPVHEGLIAQDPLFYAHLGAWYRKNGEVRDHTEMFTIMLCLSGFEGHREAGLAMLRELPPYEVGRVVDFIKGSTEDGRKWGLGKNLPRSLKTEVEHYLREREKNPIQFDGAVLHARKTLKRLYAALHIKPGPRAQAILFDDNPPEDSRLAVLKKIAKSTDPEEQAKLIAGHKIPYRVASSVVAALTPPVVRALIEVMTPQELINNIASLEERGAFQNEELRKAVEQKLEAARGASRVSALKAKVAANAAGATGKLEEALEAVAAARLQAMRKITRPTALCIDASSSMDLAIDVGRQLAALVSAICERDFRAVAFNGTARAIKAEGRTLADWERALSGLYASGPTSCGAPLDLLARENRRVEQIVLVTDGHENAEPRFVDSYRAYAEKTGFRPAVALVKVGRPGTSIEDACKTLGIGVQAFEVRDDYYALPNVLPFLTQPSFMDLAMEIMECPLPSRKP